MTYTIKTKPSALTPEGFLKKHFSKDPHIQTQARELIAIYSKVTGSKCVMWNKIFGFGKYHYLDSRGGEHEFLMTGFTISKTGFTLYNLMGWGMYKEDLKKLGTHKLSGKSCLAIKDLYDIKSDVLKKVVKRSHTDLKARYRTEK